MGYVFAPPPTRGLHRAHLRLHRRGAGHRELRRMRAHLSFARPQGKRWGLLAAAALLALGLLQSVKLLFRSSPNVSSTAHSIQMHRRLSCKQYTYTESELTSSINTLRFTVEPSEFSASSLPVLRTCCSWVRAADGGGKRPPVTACRASGVTSRQGARPALERERQLGGGRGQLLLPATARVVGRCRKCGSVNGDRRIAQPKSWSSRNMASPTCRCSPHPKHFETPSPPLPCTGARARRVWWNQWAALRQGISGRR